MAKTKTARWLRVKGRTIIIRDRYSRARDEALARALPQARYCATARAWLAPYSPDNYARARAFADAHSLACAPEQGPGLGGLKEADGR